MTPRIERRRSKRFREDAISARVALLDRTDLATEPCSLVDISFGGMCIHTPRRLGVGDIYTLLLDLQSPFNDLVMVKAQIVWIRAHEQCQMAGAEFKESTRGWLGPED